MEFHQAILKLAFQDVLQELIDTTDEGTKDQELALRRYDRAVAWFKKGKKLRIKETSPVFTIYIDGETGGPYTSAIDECNCPAGRNSTPCKHNVVALIVSRYLEISQVIQPMVDHAAKEEVRSMIEALFNKERSDDQERHA